MIDDESELRERFAELRAGERNITPPFDPRLPTREYKLAWRPLAAIAALLLLAIATTFTLRSHPTDFSESDRASLRGVAEWRPPTDFLLRTPGNELLTTTPRIPDLKGIPR
jgi:hypothetical protein